jgi:hypothetical protein
MAELSACTYDRPRERENGRKLTGSLSNTDVEGGRKAKFYKINVYLAEQYQFFQ